MQVNFSNNRFSHIPVPVSSGVGSLLLNWGRCISRVVPDQNILGLFRAKMTHRGWQSHQSPMHSLVSMQDSVRSEIGSTLWWHVLGSKQCCLVPFLCLLCSGRDVTASQMEERADTQSESLWANCGVTLPSTHKELQQEQFEEKPGPDHGNTKAPAALGVACVHEDGCLTSEKRDSAF